MFRENLALHLRKELYHDGLSKELEKAIHMELRHEVAHMASMVFYQFGEKLHYALSDGQSD